MSFDTFNDADRSPFTASGQAAMNAIFTELDVTRRERDEARAEVTRCREALEGVRLASFDGLNCLLCGRRNGRDHARDCPMNAVIEILAAAKEGPQ